MDNFLRDWWKYNKEIKRVGEIILIIFFVRVNKKF